MAGWTHWRFAITKRIVSVVSPTKALLYLVCLEEVDGSGNIKLSGHKKLYSCRLGDEPSTLRLLPAMHLAQELLHSLEVTEDKGEKRGVCACEVRLMGMTTDITKTHKSDYKHSVRPISLFCTIVTSKCYTDGSSTLASLSNCSQQMRALIQYTLPKDNSQFVSTQVVCILPLNLKGARREYMNVNRLTHHLYTTAQP